ncbi:MAG: protein kinase domain-containing protein, partial [Dolichospermum sp.]
TLLAYFEQDNRLYLVQQFIDGANLLQELKNQGIFSESKIRALLQDLLPILKVVHEYGVIHRDIKPENIMRRRSDGKLILIDFGASKQLQGTVITGTLIGTFGYAPLEQMREGEVYPASDLYSLGATCFHLLTGVHPWQLWQSDGYRWVKEWRNHLKQVVTLELGQVLDKLLQKDAQDRYQSAQEVLQDLNPLQIPPTVQALPLQRNLNSYIFDHPLAILFVIITSVLLSRITLATAGTNIFHYILAAIINIHGLYLCLLRIANRKISKDYDFLFGFMLLICGFIIFFQGWRLDPLLQLSLLLLIESEIYVSLQAIHKRG